MFSLDNKKCKKNQKKSRWNSGSCKNEEGDRVKVKTWRITKKEEGTRWKGLIK